MNWPIRLLLTGIVGFDRLSSMDEETRTHDALVRIFNLQHREHRPLCEAVDQVGAFSRATFYRIDEQLRAAAEREVLEQVERERLEVETALADLRKAEATRLGRRVVEAGETAVNTVIEVMEGAESDFNRLKAVELWLDMVRNGVVIPSSPQRPDDDKPPRLPPAPGRAPGAFLPPMDGLQPGEGYAVRRSDGLEVIVRKATETSPDEPQSP
jgi:hypothetical protein